MSSIREIAEQVTTDVAKICGCNWESCTKTRNATTDAIEQALRDERERAVKIINDMEIDPNYNGLWIDGFCMAQEQAVTAIRKED